MRHKAMEVLNGYDFKKRRQRTCTTTGRGQVSDVYPYGAQFQTKVLTLMLREPNFMVSHGDIIRPEFFDSEVHARIARLVGNFCEKQNMTPKSFWAMPRRTLTPKV